MTAQTRYGRATVEAAHALDREPASRPWTLGDVAGGIVLAAVLCLLAYYGPAALLVLSDALRGWAGVR